MTKTDDYWYYPASGGSHQFKITETTDWTGKEHTKICSECYGTDVALSGGNGSNISCGESNAHYIIFFPSSDKICASKSLPTKKTATVRVKKENYFSDTTPKLYAWDLNENAINGAFPGTAMSLNGSYYEATISYFTSTYSFLVCKTGDSDKTGDQTGKTSSVCISVASDKSVTYASNVPPSVTTTNSAANLTTEGADIGGNISSKGTSSACATATLSRRGVRVYSNEACTTEVSGSPFYDTTNSIGDYTVTVTGLSPSTQYWYRAYAKNNNSSNNEVTDTGNKYTFTTLSDCDPPTFTAPDATSWCDGSPGTLTVSTKTSGSTIKWWESESSSTPLYSGDSYTPASFTATTTYYISATKDDCPSARQSVTVTKIALPSLSLGLSPSTVYPWDVATITATTTCTESTLVWKLYQGESLITTGAGSGSTYTFGKTSNTVYTLKGISSSGSGSSVTYTVKVDGNDGTCNAAQATQNVTISAAATESCAD